MSDEQGRDITVSRVLDASPERVWRAMTVPQALSHWWGPRGCTATVQTMDLRPGGAWIYRMNVYGLTSFHNHSVFTEVVEHERIVYTNGSGKEGHGASDFESALLLQAEGGGSQTNVTFRIVFATPFFRDQFARKYSAVDGGRQTLERLAGYLAETAATEA
nr:SRPBCC domain-containing protein [uncultured Rhodopila sp.]